MNLYQFSRYSQHIADRTPGPDLRRHTDIGRKYRYFHSFSLSVSNPSVTTFQESAIVNLFCNTGHSTIQFLRLSFGI
jgi:hypothetical protein